MTRVRRYVQEAVPAAQLLPLAPFSQPPSTTGFFSLPPKGVYPTYQALSDIVDLELVQWLVRCAFSRRTRAVSYPP